MSSPSLSQIGSAKQPAAIALAQADFTVRTLCHDILWLTFCTKPTHRRQAASVPFRSLHEVGFGSIVVGRARRCRLPLYPSTRRMMLSCCTVTGVRAFCDRRGKSITPAVCLLPAHLQQQCKHACILAAAERRCADCNSQRRYADCNGRPSDVRFIDLSFFFRSGFMCSGGNSCAGLVDGQHRSKVVGYW